MVRSGRRRVLLVSFGVVATLAVASWLILENGRKPCNVDDFTGCSAVGEVAVYGFIFLGPLAITLGLVLVLLWLGDLLQRR